MKKFKFTLILNDESITLDSSEISGDTDAKDAWKPTSSKDVRELLEEKYVNLCDFLSAWDWERLITLKVENVETGEEATIFSREEN